MSTRVELVHEGPVSRVRFLSEKGVQLLSAPVRAQLANVVSELERRDDCRVALFDAEGSTFIAGADIKELQTLEPAGAEQLAQDTHALFDRIEALPAVTIAAVHAACAGGGFELALCCDLRLMAEDARIGLPEVSLGLIPGWGGTVRMTRLFGPAVARHVILRGELLRAPEALRLGLVSGIAAPDEFRQYVQQEVDGILQRSPDAVRAAKRFIRHLADANRAVDFEQEGRAFGRCYESRDAREGITAFLEKRQPQWESAGEGHTDDDA